MRIGLMFLPISAVKSLGARFKGIGSRITALFPGLKYDLANAQIELSAEHYAVGSFFSALLWAFFALIFLIVVSIARKFEAPQSFLLPIGGFLFVAFGFLLLHMYYPRITSKSVSAKIDRGLVFAARDMLIQVSSGIPLYQTLANVGEGDYDQVSVEFKKVVNEARSGRSLTTALENMALRNQSKYLKKMSWQIITAMRSGSNLTKALKGIIKMLVDYQLRQIKAYNSELNFIVLIYLLAAAVLPTVGTTILVIFSVFGVLGVTQEVYLGLVGIGVLVQLIIIGYVYVRRPKMYE
ncbi:MAG: type II secretion system F family protein [Candidatus Micrarchaeota archaeon]